MDIKQNFLVTVMRGKFSLYEVRLFCCIVMHANSKLNGKKISDFLGTSVSADGLNCNMRIPFSAILTAGSKDGSKVLEAANSLVNKKIEFFDTSKGKYIYHSDHLINNVRHVDGSGILEFTVSTWLLEYILDFMNGNFSLYSFENALKIPTSYGVRMYWLTCSLTGPVNYPIRMLRDILGCGDKYSNSKDFVRCCIEQPRQLLEKMHLNGYNYQRSAERGSKAFIHFMPVKREDKTANQIMTAYGGITWIKAPLRQYLTTQAEFTSRMFKVHQELMVQFGALKGYEDKIVSIVERSRRRRGGPGYIINAMKSEVRKAASADK